MSNQQQSVNFNFGISEMPKDEILTVILRLSAILGGRPELKRRQLEIMVTTLDQGLRNGNRDNCFNGLQRKLLMRRLDIKTQALSIQLKEMYENGWLELESTKDQVRNKFTIPGYYWEMAEVVDGNTIFFIEGMLSKIK